MEVMKMNMPMTMNITYIIHIFMGPHTPSVLVSLRERENFLLNGVVSM